MVTKYSFSIEEPMGKRVYYLVFKENKLIYKAKMGTIDNTAHPNSLKYCEEIPVDVQKDFVEQNGHEISGYESIAELICVEGKEYILVLTRDTGEWTNSSIYEKKKLIYRSISLEDENIPSDALYYQIYHNYVTPELGVDGLRVTVKPQDKKVEQRLHDIQELIRIIEGFDDVPDPEGGVRKLLEGYDESLRRLSCDELCTRIWTLNGRLHCVVLYPNDVVRTVMEEGEFVW